MSESLILIALLLLPGNDDAREDADQAAYVGERNGTRIYEFEDDELEGEVLRAEGVNVGSRSSPHHDSLLEIRTSFTPELTRLTLDL
jgi:hypothetical protein